MNSNKQNLLKKITGRIFLLAVIFLFFISTSLAQEPEEDQFHIPGTVEGSGKHFEIIDSEYLNLTLDSSEEIKAKIESAPEMIVFEIQPSNSAGFANLTLSGFASGVTYHKYEDNYHNYMPAVADENGAFSFTQDISQNHIIFIQPRKSTKFIQDNATGGDCANIGIWNASSKTCALTQDLNETVQIDNDGITMDGNGHTIIGSKTGTGINIYNKKNIVVKNITVSNFYYGIFISSSARENKIFFNTFKNNTVGVYLQYSSMNIISDNVISQNRDSGLSLYYSVKNNFSNNTIGPVNNYGIFQSWQNYYNGITNNTYENNNVSGNNNMGIYIYGGNGDVLKNNKIDNNLSGGISIVEGRNQILTGNIISENKISNFSILGGDMSTNNIDISNIVEEKPVYYITNTANQSYDDGMDIGIFYCVNCENIILRNSSLSKNNAKIYLRNTNNSLVENITSPDETIEATLVYSNNNTIRKNTFKKIYANASNNNQIYNNNFMGVRNVAQLDFSSGNLFNLDLPIGGNYWKSYEQSCWDKDNNGFCDNPYDFNYQEGTDEYPWIKKFDIHVSPMPSGNSNVLFLPGIKASKLYKSDFGDEDQLWPPNYFGNDIEELMLDENGESIENVYTNDVLKETTAGNIYKSFLADLEELKSQQIINDYKDFAYDWRQDAEDIAKNGTPYQNIVKSLTAEIQTLSDSSKNKKVAIVAHSNGGLVAKAAMLELEKLGLTDKVDKIIFVATPQMGTPITTLSMLYGYEESLAWGTLMSREEARKLAENMPGAYGLLPTETYFDRMENPFITFSSENTRYKIFKDAYGEGIDNLGEFKNFLLGIDDQREKPKESDVESENILNQKLLEETIEMHKKLDDWTPPSNIQVIEIAGWGLDTISGVDYTEKEKTECSAFFGSKIPFCIGTNKYEPIYDPKFTVDGDKVVVSPSALMFSEAENVKRYWVDLKLSDTWTSIGREHKDILELDSVERLISNTVTNNNDASLPKYISVSRPEYIDNNSRIRMSLYSPLDIHLYDDNGNHTGPKTITDENGNEQIIFEENIPNSYYYQFGERKYVGVPAGEHIRVEMNGYDMGTYTLKLEEVKATAAGEETVSRAIFENFPTTADTIVKMDIPETGIAEKLSVKADIDSDGKDDYAVDSVPGGTVEFPDLIPPEIAVNSPENKDYANNQILKLDYSIIDNISKTENIKTGIFYDEKIFSEKEIDLSLQNLGEHKISIFAEDEAGNKSNVEIAFNVVSNIDAISQNVEHYFDLKLIADTKTKNFLQVKINEIDHVLDMIEKMGGKNNENPKVNQIRLLNKKIDDLVGFIQGKLKDTILSPAKEVLIQSLNFIKI